MKLLMHPVAVGFGLAVLTCLGLIAPLIDPSHRWIYHDNGPPSAIFLPVLINIAIVWLFFALLFLLARRPGRMRVLVWSGSVLLTPWLIVEEGGLLGAWTVSPRASLALLVFLCACWAVFTAGWRPSFEAGFESLQQFANTLFAFSSLSAIFVVGQLLWCFWQARGLQAMRPVSIRSSQETPRATGPTPRVIWIIFDELSYQQVYERRFPDLMLPAFDQFASESTLFTGVVPAANYTDAALPSLITGFRIDKIRASADGMLRSLHDPTTGHWHSFRPENTAFQDARDRGVKTAIAGWYNPYCRVFSEVLDQCLEEIGSQYERGMVSDWSILSNVAAPWVHGFQYVRQRGHLDLHCHDCERGHLGDFQRLSWAGNQFLADSSIGFLLIHLPIPHPGGIYDRRTAKFTMQDGSYIDNLALADLYLAHVRQLLQERNEWDSSAVLVMGDHSWRTASVWQGTPYWTSEDQLASRGGQFDPRPAYLIKLPYQTAGARILNPFDAVHTRTLIQKILTGQIQTSTALAAFAASTTGD